MTVDWTPPADLLAVDSMSSAAPEGQSAEVVARLVESHREFLSFLERRLPTREAAEEVLQAAFVRSLEKADTVEDSESAVAWFYRLLRNAITDYYRREARAGRAHERYAAGAETAEAAKELEEAICACMRTLLPNLKAEYADLLNRVDLGDTPVAEAAAALDITANNAGVRLHRARHALRRELERSCGTCATHGCLSCSCRSTV